MTITRMQISSSEVHTNQNGCPKSLLWSPISAVWILFFILLECSGGPIHYDEEFFSNVCYLILQAEWYLAPRGVKSFCFGVPSNAVNWECIFLLYTMVKKCLLFLQAGNATISYDPNGVSSFSIMCYLFSLLRMHRTLLYWEKWSPFSIVCYLVS